MAARVTADQVKEIITTQLSNATVLGSMIDTAHVFVNAHLLDAGHSDAILEKIELYLAAHFVALTEERGALTISKTGDAMEEYAFLPYGAGLNLTRYGQHALLLDTSGILASKGVPKPKAQFRVV